VSKTIADGNFPADLAGKTLSSPQLGNTQDIALRAWLATKGLATNINGGGQVTIDSSSGNSVSLQNFEAGKIAGGWVPEPYESEFIIQGKGTLAVDEASLWPNGQFPTTVLVVTQNLLENHPDIVRDLLKGLVQSVNWINANESTAPAAVNAALAASTGGKLLKSAVLALAWTHLSFALDPLQLTCRPTPTTPRSWDSTRRPPSRGSSISCRSTQSSLRQVIRRSAPDRSADERRVRAAPRSTDRRGR